MGIYDDPMRSVVDYDRDEQRYERRRAARTGQDEHPCGCRCGSRACAAELAPEEARESGVTP